LKNFLLLHFHGVSTLLEISAGVSNLAVTSLLPNKTIGDRQLEHIEYRVSLHRRQNRVTSQGLGIVLEHRVALLVFRGFEWVEPLLFLLSIKINSSVAALVSTLKFNTILGCLRD
jgi:hypothetical protein